MKKTLTVNINGVVFHIDEDAYYKLSRYLERIKAHFKNEYGGEEIIAGIESRIAEMFQERKKSSQQVVNIAEVQEVISQLGEPAEMSGDQDERSERRETNDYAEETASKQLFRDPDNKYIGGVCSGLAAYFNIDPTWVRLLFVLLIFAAGSTILAYIILWIVIPKARTTADRLSMRGERINLSNIEKSIREDLRDIKRNLEDLSKKA
jgi:phage shock protein PspC (stress-responsive transcriptional regulator)